MLQCTVTLCKQYRIHYQQSGGGDEDDDDGDGDGGGDDDYDDGRKDQKHNVK